MIVLDTNVISELMKDNPDPHVSHWAKSARVGNLWITSITVAEVLVGIERLPEGRRKRALATAAEHWIDGVFHDRVLAFGAREARLYASLFVTKVQLGHQIDMPDAQIAAIARSVGATLATRNTKDFLGTGIDLINPWDESTPVP